jgi:transcription elongation factor GreB
MSAEGARLLREEMAAASRRRATELQQILDSATVVPEREEPAEEVLFGTTVTVRSMNGKETRYRIVGVDETRLGPGWVSWVSPLARALIGTPVGQQVHLPEGDEVTIVAIDG